MSFKDRKPSSIHVALFYELQSAQARRFSLVFLVSLLAYIPVYLITTPYGNMVPLVGNFMAFLVHALAFVTYFTPWKLSASSVNRAHAISLFVFTLIASAVHPEVQVKIYRSWPYLFEMMHSGPPNCGGSTLYTLHTSCQIEVAFYTTMLLNATLFYFAVFILNRRVALVTCTFCVSSYVFVVMTFGKYNNCLEGCRDNPNHHHLEFVLLGLNSLIAVLAKGLIECSQKSLYFEVRAKETEVVHEKILRCRAEFNHSMDTDGLLARADDALTAMTTNSKVASSLRVVTNFDASGIDKSAALEEFASFAKKEHWYIATSDILVQPHHILGVGGFGVVIAGRHQGAPVALKIARGEFDDSRGLRALANELRVLRHIRHPNVVNFFGACIDIETSVLALVMERVDGIRLDNYIDNITQDANSRLSRYDIILHMSSTLSCLHNLEPPVAHCDLKPANVMIENGSQGLRPKLLDFGLAHLSVGQTCIRRGTLEWMAPEVARDDGPVDQLLADVYSFGRVMHFILTGIKIFDGLPKNLVLRRLKQQDSTLLKWPRGAGLAEDCVSLINECVHVDSCSRPDMRSVRSRLFSALFQDTEHNVDWKQGVKELHGYQSLTGDLVAHFNVCDGSFAQVPDDWMVLCGECDNVYELFASDGFEKQLRGKATELFKPTDVPNQLTTLDLGLVQGRGARGRRFKAHASVKFLVSHQKSSKEGDHSHEGYEDCMAILSLGRLRMEVLPAWIKEEHMVSL